jgi:signal recognition particle GTPase
VKFVGLGEKPGDFATFDADQFVEALFGDAA